MNKKMLLMATLLCFNITHFIHGVPSTSTPTVSRTYSDRQVTQAPNTRSLGGPGILNNAFGTSGSLSITNSLTNPQTRGIVTLADGSIATVLNTSANSYLVKYSQAGILASSSFATGTGGIFTLTGVTGTNGSLLVNSQGNFLIRATNPTATLKQVLANGSAYDSTFNFTDGAAWGNQLNAVAYQSTDKIIAVGWNGAYGMIRRYLTSGALDVSFGSSGQIVLDGSIGTLPAAFACNGVIVDANNLIYVLFNDGSNLYVARFTASGSLDTTFASGSGYVLLSAFTSLNPDFTLTKSFMCLAFDASGNIIVGARNSTNVIVTGVTSSGSAIGGFTNFNTSSIATLGSNNFNLTMLMPTSDGNILVCLSDETTKKMVMLCLAANGSLNTSSFNAAGSYPGVNEFSVGSPGTSAIASACALNANNQMYVVGWQVNAGVTTPYLSCLLNQASVTAVAQYPASGNQGDLSPVFGGTSGETGDGIVRPFVGYYGALLQQKTAPVIQLSYSANAGKFLLATDGYTDTNANANMILTELNSDGTLNTGFNTTGQLVLPKTYTNEYVSSIIDDQGGNIILGGYDGTGNVFVRKYSSAGAATWSSSGITAGGVNAKILAIGITTSQRILAFGQTDATHGIIYAINPLSGALDTTFNPGGATAGQISTADWSGSLATMGPIYSACVDALNNIYIAYKNNSTNNVDVALIYQNGSRLVPSFNVTGTTPGIINNVFNGVSGGTAVSSSQDIRIGFDNNEMIVVAAVLSGTSGNYTVRRFLQVEGTQDLTFGTSGTATITAGTTLALSQLTCLNDNSIIVTGYNNVTSASNNYMVVSRLTSAGILDTTFNPLGATAGILPLQIGHVISSYYARVASGLVVQASTGNMILAGYEQQTSTQSIPMVMDIYGKSGTTQVQQFPVVSPVVAGEIDLTFGSGGYLDLAASPISLSAGATKAVYTYPSANTYQGYYLVGVDTGTQIQIARLRQNDDALDTTFGTDGITTIASTTGLQALTVDANNNVLIAGGTGASNGAWAYRLSPNGSTATSANGTTLIGFATTSNFKLYNDIKQQKSGRYILVGIDANSKGGIVAYQDNLVAPATTFAIDTTFNALATTALATSGMYEITAATTLPTLVLNTDDTILVAYQDTTVKIAKVMANGSGLNTSANGAVTFGTAGILDTGITPSSATAIRIAIDASNQVIVASSVSGNSVSVNRYSANGGTTFFNGGSSVVKNITGLGSAGVVLRSLMIDTLNQILLFGDNTSGANGRIFSCRLNAVGTLDIAWNSVPTSPDVAGIHTFSLDGSTNVYGTSIFINGDIYLAGAAGSTVPLVMCMYGDSYITQVAQQPLQVGAGILDTTLDTLTPGLLTLNLNNYLSTLNLTGSTSKLLHLYADGSMLFAFNKGFTTIVAKMNQAFQLDTTGFNAGGAYSSPAGSVTITSAGTVNDMYVNDGINGDNCVYLAGTNSGTPWAAKISASGVLTVLSLPNTASLRFVSRIRVTSHGRIIIAGATISASLVVAYVPDGSALDLSFGNGTGYYTNSNLTGNSIADIAINQYDEMFIAYKNGSNIQVDRIEPNGSGLATALWTTGTPGTLTLTPTTAFSITQIRLFVDETYDNSTYNLIVAAQDGTSGSNKIIVNRYRTSGTATSTGSTFLSLSSKVLNLSDLFIDTTPTNYDIYAIGYNSTDNTGVVGRITTTASTLTMDSSYGTSGIANLTSSAMTVVAGGLHPDRRVYLLGTQPVMARVFGDAYVIEVQKENAVGAQGAIDLTLDGYRTTTPDGGIVIPGLVGYTGYGLYTNADGTSYVAFGNGTNLIVGKLDADGNLITSFGGNTTGLTTPVTMAVVNGLIVNAAGNILVVGSAADGSIQKVVSFPTSGTPATVFSNPLFMTGAGTAIAQQKSGRYLASGLYVGAGAIIAYLNDGTSYDTTYGPQGNLGFYATGLATQIDDMVLDSNDNAYIVYRDLGDHVILEKVDAQGGALVAGFTGGETGIIATQPAKIAINNTGNILVGATTSSGVVTRLYNGSTGIAISAAQTITSANSPVLTDVMADANNNFVGSVYTTTPMMIAFRVLGVSGLIDGSFGASGLASYRPESATRMNGIAIQPDGTVSMIGGQTTPSINPVFMSLYGSSYVADTAQYPGRVGAGIIDPTLFPSTGALDLNALFAGVPNLIGYTAARIYTYPVSNDNMLILFTNSTSYILVRCHKDFSVDTSFNSSGYIYRLGLPGLTTIPSLFVNSEGSIFVAGGAGTSFVDAYNADGSALTTSAGWTTPTFNLSAGLTAMGQQSMSRLIIAGQNSNGTLYGYTTTGELDQEFASGGIFSTGVGQSIADISIQTADDNILLVYNDGSNSSVLKRLLADGSAYDGTLPGTGTAITSVNGNELRVVNDGNAGHIIVAAATTTGFTLARYSAVNGANSGAQVTISAGGSSTSHIARLYVDSQERIVLVGYETTSNNVVVVRLNSSFALDSTFGTNGVFSATVGSINKIWDGAVYADNRIYAIGSDGIDPFMARVFGDTYVTELAQASSIGVAGTLDTTYHAPTGSFNIGTLNGILAHSMPQATIPTSVGGHYIGLSNSSGASYIIKTTQDDALDTSYNSSGIGGSTPGGLKAMILDGSDRIVSVGSTGSGSTGGWIQINAAGGGIQGQNTSSNMNLINAVVQQTMAGYVVAGLSSDSWTAIQRYTYDSTLDVTFGSNGRFVLNDPYYNSSSVYSLVADVNDRLIFACVNSNTGYIDLIRLTSNGELDNTFGPDNSGIVSGAISAETFSESTVRVVLDNNNRIIVVATTQDGTGVNVAAFDNLNASSGNGAAIGGYIAGTPVSGLTGALVTSFVATEDGNVLLAGSQSGNYPMWIARLTSTGTLDTTEFNPNSVGGPAGIMLFTVSGSVQSSRQLTNIAILPDGRISFVGYEIASAVITPYMARAYNNPYEVSVAECPNSLPIGNQDITWGLNNPQSLSFFGYPGSSTAQNQIARAIALENYDRVVVAVNGENPSTAGVNQVFLDRFIIDGLLDTTFNTTGQVQLPNSYNNQYAQDVATFTTVQGVNKAILAGYVMSGAPLNITTSWLMQYNLDLVEVDASFGGIDHDAQGVASGDIQQFNSIGLQSSGRAIASGINYGGTAGAILGYNSLGNLDTTFGSNGFYFPTPTFSAIYSHAIDSQDRIVFAYVTDGTVYVSRLLADGSGIDTSFGTVETGIVDVTDITQVRVAVNGNDEVFVAAVNGGGLLYYIYHYGVNGGLMVSNGIGVGSLGTPTPTELKLARMFVDQDGALILVGTAVTSTTTDYLVVKLTTMLGFDATFNGTGYLRFTVNSTRAARNATSGVLHSDGRIFVVGEELA